MKRGQRTSPNTMDYSSAVNFTEYTVCAQKTAIEKLPYKTQSAAAEKGEFSMLCRLFHSKGSRGDSIIKGKRWKETIALSTPTQRLLGS
ncbi:hypothetical protein NPIL_23741 [Nephila pilipes]|uniref:Uncharacterized protein n=1 Tax=Nephila pilipes TaxID=299642 RepID=A0A8X6MT12_NEPPI|nr:hypothetical protein NPIL_384231 [Nephila pilipes]GFT26990.1 hypothetical protein NPIL_525101 [Nephila pilipes]GFU30817.1 hypothetical protein NPIL_639961 [Nephila pilipes]GFU46538.1 hypothetical protein NPIL_23741 [Nephila pilipes]